MLSLCKCRAVSQMCTTHLYSDIQYFCKFHQCSNQTLHVTRLQAKPKYVALHSYGPGIWDLWALPCWVSFWLPPHVAWWWSVRLHICWVASWVSSFLSMNPLTVGRITLLGMSCSTGERQLEFGTFHCVLRRSSELFTCCWKVVHVAKKQTCSQRSSLIQFWTCLSQS